MMLAAIAAATVAGAPAATELDMIWNPSTVIPVTAVVVVAATLIAAMRGAGIRAK